MRTDSGPAVQTGRHKRLMGRLSTGAHSGRVLPQRQIEVTGGDRVWYLLDVEKHTVWVSYAGAHPKATEQSSAPVVAAHDVERHLRDLR